MTIPLPLQVLMLPINGSTGWLDITDYTENLEWHHTIPGGFAAVSFDLNTALTALPEFDPYSLVQVWDTLIAEQIFAGLLLDPARAADASGEAYRMQALGASSTFKDITQPRIWIDSSLESWGRGQPPYQLEAVTTQVDKADIVNGPGICMTANSGTGLDASTGLSYVTYLPFIQTGQKIGSVDVTDAGGPGGDTSFLVRYSVAAGDVRTHPMSTSTTSVVLLSGIDFDPIDAVSEYMNLAWETGGSAVDAQDGLWQRFGNIYVKPVLATAAGVTVESPPTNYTTWFEVVGDLLGGSTWLELIDGPSAYLSPAGPPPQPIPHFAYPDGTTAEDVLKDLMTTEQAYYWAAWEQLENGKYRFEWQVWPTEVTYDFDLAFEYLDSPGSASDLYNAVTVRWRDPTGNINSQTFTGDCPILDLAGLVRCHLIDLGDNVDSYGITVTSTAEQFLAEHVFPTRSGTLTVHRNVYNNILGVDIPPWNLRPPFLCSVSGDIPGDIGDTRDGLTVFRCIGVRYRTGDAAAILELDTTPLTTANQLRWAAPQGRRR